MKRSEFPSLGFGVGLRRPHYGEILDSRPPMDWFEAISENFMVAGGRALEAAHRAPNPRRAGFSWAAVTD
jgi:uncharacterized protein (UPF0276 family)